jgi:hypothetical protein
MKRPIRTEKWSGNARAAALRAEIERRPLTFLNRRHPAHGTHIPTRVEIDARFHAQMAVVTRGPGWTRVDRRSVGHALSNLNDRLNAGLASQSRLEGR